MKRIQLYIIPSLILLGLILRIIGANARTLDGDEGVILAIANGPISHVLSSAARDVHPPLFHILTSFALAIGGISTLALRSISIIAGTILVALAPILAKRLNINAILLTAVFATSPYLINLSQDARMYSLFVLLTVVSWLMMLRLWENRDSFRYYLYWTIAGVLLVLTHHLGWLVIFGELLATLIWQRELIRNPWRLLGGLFILGVAYLPQLPTTINQFSGRLSEQNYSVSLFDRITSTIGALYRMLAGRIFLDLNPTSIMAMAENNSIIFIGLLITLIIPFTLLLFGLIKIIRSNNNWLILPIFGLVSALLVGTIAVHAPRYLSFIAPFVLILVAIGIKKHYQSLIINHQFYKRLSSTFLFIAYFLTIIAGLWGQYSVHNRAPGLNAYAQAIESDSKTGDVVLIRGAFAGGEKTAFEYYYDQKLPVIDIFGDYSVGNLAELRKVKPTDKISTLLDRYDRVWFFDQTYTTKTIEEFDSAYPVETQELGYDKEHKELKLYLIKKEIKR